MELYVAHDLDEGAPQREDSSSDVGGYLLGVSLGRRPSAHRGLGRRGDRRRARETVSG